MPKIQRDPTTHKIQRDATTHKVIRGESSPCCCGGCDFPCCSDYQCATFVFDNFLGDIDFVGPNAIYRYITGVLTIPFDLVSTDCDLFFSRTCQNSGLELRTVTIINATGEVTDDNTVVPTDVCVRATMEIVCDGSGIKGVGGATFGTIAGSTFTPTISIITVGASDIVLTGNCDQTLTFNNPFHLAATWVETGDATFNISTSACADGDCSDECISEGDPCPEPCIDCFEACGLRCWYGATLTVDYAIITGECGTCASYGDELGDGGCRRCKSCQPTRDPVTGDVTAECLDYLVFSDADCLSHEPPGYIWCRPDCTEPDGGISVCSFIDFSGSIELACEILTGNPHFTASLDLGADVLDFEVWFDCVAGRWCGTITVNDFCVFSGDLNGDCDNFPGVPNLVGSDTGIGGDNCQLLGQLGGAAVEYSTEDYFCPD